MIAAPEAIDALFRSRPAARDDAGRLALASRTSTSRSAVPRRSNSTASSARRPTPGSSGSLPYQTEMIVMRLLAGKRDLADKLVRTGSVDLSYSLAKRTRFRVNVFAQRGSYSIVLRVIPNKIPTVEELGIPPQLERDRQRAQRNRARHRPHRLRQVHHPGRHHQQDQPGQRHPHHHDRGPDRVPAPAQEVHDQPARGRRGHPDVRPRPARRPAPGAQGDPRRRDARRGDDLDRAGGLGDGPPRALHAAHDRRQPRPSTASSASSPRTRSGRSARASPRPSSGWSASA